MSHQISPEIAAHNISSIFSRKYIETLNNKEILNVNSIEIRTAAINATQIYEIVYDATYEQISKSNALSINDSE